MAFIMPPIAQPQDYHHFVDVRRWMGIPRALDVLSNIAFFMAGLFGLRAISAKKSLYPKSIMWSLEVFFWGVLLTAFGSAYYHWNPLDSTLVLDRLPMTIAFSGICGALGSSRVSPRAGFAALFLALTYGFSSIAVWQSTGNLAPYAIMQFGGMAWLFVAAIFGQRRPIDLPWLGLLGFYVAAKIMEHFDQLFYILTQGLISGHTAKNMLRNRAKIS